MRNLRTVPTSEPRKTTVWLPQGPAPTSTATRVSWCLGPGWAGVRLVPEPLRCPGHLERHHPCQARWAWEQGCPSQRDRAPSWAPACARLPLHLPPSLPGPYHAVPGPCPVSCLEGLAAAGSLSPLPSCPQVAPFFLCTCHPGLGSRHHSLPTAPHRNPSHAWGLTASESARSRARGPGRAPLHPSGDGS